MFLQKLQLGIIIIQKKTILSKKSCRVCFPFKVRTGAPTWIYLDF